jgi:hypothetical protein
MRRRATLVGTITAATAAGASGAHVVRVGVKRRRRLGRIGEHASVGIHEEGNDVLIRVPQREVNQDES